MNLYFEVIKKHNTVIERKKKIQDHFLQLMRDNPKNAGAILKIVNKDEIIDVRKNIKTIINKIYEYLHE